MDRVFRLVNASVAAATLASALAVLAADLFDAGYRAHYRDALWFVAAYAAVQVFMLVAFVRDSRLAPWLVLAKTAVAYLFLLGFVAVWPYWRFWTPARYVYQLFAWGDGSAVGLFALVFLGRGVFNTLNAVYFGRNWLLTMRVRYPLAGRLVSIFPAGVAMLCAWIFFGLVRQEQRTFSPEAQSVAREILATLDCDAVRAHDGQTIRDIRRRGQRTYQVEIAYACPSTRVTVRVEDGRAGTASADRPECCGVTPPAAPRPTAPGT